MGLEVVFLFLGSWCELEDGMMMRVRVKVRVGEDVLFL